MSDQITIIIEETVVQIGDTLEAVAIFESAPVLPSPRAAGDMLVAVTAAGFVVARPLISRESAQILFNDLAEMVTA